MFGRRAPSQVVASPVALAPPPRPVARPVAVGSEPLGAYEALAEELGFMPAQLLEEQLRRFFAESQIPIFNYAAVDAYLAAIAEKEGEVWIWRPLREKDKPSYRWLGRENLKKTVIAARGHGSYIDEWTHRPYSRAIPIHILRQVKSIQGRFGDQVKFFVSDYAVPNPDPFIMVSALDVSFIIFGVWDEPGFDTGK